MLHNVKRDVLWHSREKVALSADAVKQEALVALALSWADVVQFTVGE